MVYIGGISVLEQDQAVMVVVVCFAQTNNVPSELLGELLDSGELDNILQNRHLNGLVTSLLTSCLAVSTTLGGLTNLVNIGVLQQDGNPPTFIIFPTKSPVSDPECNDSHLDFVIPISGKTRSCDYVGMVPLTKIAK
jgi:hypothetical protein